MVHSLSTGVVLALDAIIGSTRRLSSGPIDSHSKSRFAISTSNVIRCPRRLKPRTRTGFRHLIRSYATVNSMSGTLIDSSRAIASRITSCTMTREASARSSSTLAHAREEVALARERDVESQFSEPPWD